MELMGRLVDQKVYGARVAISVLACSKGAEVYSILWSIRTSRPDLKVTLQAVDISQEIVNFAKEGAYTQKDPASLKVHDHFGMTEEEKLICTTCRDQGSDQSASLCHRMDDSEMHAMFD